MASCSRVRSLTMLTGALALASVLAACGVPEALTDELSAGKAGRLEDRAGGGADQASDGEGDDGAGVQVVPGTKREAQALVDAAEQRLLEEPDADFDVSWTGGGFWETPIEGRFDAEQLAAEVTIEMGEDDRYELRLLGEDTWVRATVDGRPMDCWMHMTGGPEEGGPMGLPYQALLLLEPVALGFLELPAGATGPQGFGDQVVVELRLDEALPAALPQLGGPTRKPLDPRARVRAVADVGAGPRYRSIEYEAADLVDALAASKGGVPRELRRLVAEPTMRAIRVQIDYRNYGSGQVRIAVPPRAKVADFGSWSDLLAGLEDPAAREPGGAPSCDAALRGA
ncbi:hypothetical protein RB608_02590 [Nocardioides sp. LHD-245]|uniref:hypothetical protein n=1 Tax=Nocardioides sp. LHD-245 TaxID=3051387 RepID=UPI0027DEC449|nr:hypothetical protein [Nocardioides sp. LHD-245]